MEVIEARSRAELVVIRQRLHDAWFDVPEAGASPQSGVLTLGGVDDHVVLEQVRTFGPLAELKRGRARTKLVISNVLDVEVIDDARIGNFDLGGLEFEDEWLVISGNVPVEVRCHLTGLEVRAEISDDLVPAGRSWGLRGGTRPVAPGGPFGPADAVTLAVIGVVLVVVDLVFIAIAKHAGSHRSGGPVVVWFVLQAAVVFAGGVVQGVRRRAWWEVGLVAAVAAAVLAFAVLVAADPTAGTAQCPSSQSCDTSFGLGAIFIGGVAFVALGAVAAAGRALGGVLKRRPSS